MAQDQLRSDLIEKNGQLKHAINGRHKIQSNGVESNGTNHHSEKIATIETTTTTTNNNNNNKSEPKTETKPKFDPTEKPESDERVKPPSQFSLGVLIIKFLVVLMDIITFPIYYFVQKPWLQLAEQTKVRAKLSNKYDPYSAYIPNVKPNSHYVYRAETLPEAQQLVRKLNPNDMPLLGRRTIENINVEITAKGKKYKKYKMTNYQWMTNAEVDDKIGQLARGFLTNGIKYQEKVLIFAETRMEWLLCAQALFRIGAVVTTLYSTLGLKSILFGIKETEVEHVITTSDLLDQLIEIIDKAEHVKKIYVIDVHPGLLKTDSPLTQEHFNKAIAGQNRTIELISYDKLCKMGNDIKENDFEYTRPNPQSLAVIMFTSGSTGNPKGVLFTHNNLIKATHAAYGVLPQDMMDNCGIHGYYGMLPLAHIFELVVELAVFNIGVRIGFGSPYTMVDTSTAIMKGQKGDLKLLRPTFMAGVPLVLDRIRKTITERVERKDNVFLKQFVKFLLAYRNYWLDRGFDTPLINKFICKRLNGNLGGNLQFIISGGAPLSPETHRMMRAFLNVQIIVGYGTTETCGPACTMFMKDLSIGRIGVPLDGVKVRLVDWPEAGYSVHDKPYPRGELLVGGETITKGYYKLEDKTKESYEEKDGIWWFKTGDIGEVNEFGSFRIIDRRKDLIKLQFGEYIALGKVESELKTFSYLENICVYGDSLHSYLIALLQPNRLALKNLAIKMNKENLSFEQQCQDPDIIIKITIELKQFCSDAGLHKMETPQKIKLVTEEWTPYNFLTASMKIKRRELEKFYEKQINALYGN